MESSTTKLKWYSYVAAFFAGIFLANTIPHYVNGISGNPFPSPFGNPPGIGSSSPLSNVIWGSFNLFLGYLLARAGKIGSQRKILLFIFFIGIVVQGIMLSLAFSHKSA